MAVDVAIACAKAVFMILLVLQVMGLGVFFERKVSAVIQDRIGANRAAILGFAGLGMVNTLVADPVKFLLKEDVTPAGADRFLHFLAPIIAVVPAVAAFAVIPFGDVLEAGGRVITLQAAQLNVGVLYVLAMAALGVYGVVIAGWASNNRWSLLGGIRGSAQMISYEIAMGLALIGVVLTYGTLDLQDMVRQQGKLIWGWLPAWGVFYQPLAFILFLVAGIAESKRIPFDLPESESELVSGYFTEYSGAKHLMFMMADFVEVVLVAALITTFFFGGWQVPWLMRDGFHLFGQVYAVPAAWIVVPILQVTSFMLKVIFFTFFQIVVRWTLPRFRYDQLMRLGWQGLLPVGLVNVMVTAAVILAAGTVA
ncbi:MAG TPA: NADH-quinone oxidoreductase subunit NuoH [Candidatus Limnocylindria bacterium]|nr:NADH-quinone oxidoreductase subunit NuoH [Candidatus Limnocylindria bacterium]